MAPRRDQLFESVRAKVAYLLAMGQTAAVSGEALLSVGFPATKKVYGTTNPALPTRSATSVIKGAYGVASVGTVPIKRPGAKNAIKMQSPGRLNE
ncbi:MAG: hypothetical protein N3G20_10920 [Verrucomicrobiae bacterium]|nr:hypothetical protein [Verrucomicrobiae bacterium]